MLSVGVGGYMQQRFGHADREDGSDGGIDTQAAKRTPKSTSKARSNPTRA